MNAFTKPRCSICTLSLLLSSACLFAQSDGIPPSNSIYVDFSKDAGLYEPTMPPVHGMNSSGRPIVSFVLSDSQPDVTFIDYSPRPCPAKYANCISNTNLFSGDESDFLKRILAKYGKNNENGADSVRTASGDGYDVSFAQGGTWVAYRVDPKLRGDDYISKQIAITNHSDWHLQIQQVKHGQLNGLRVEFYGGHIGSVLHFQDDMAVGDWFDWDPAGNLRLAAKFNKPFNLFGSLKFLR